MSTLRVDVLTLNDTGNATISVANSWNVSISTGGATRMTIAGGGKIGIGTTNPTANLDVVGSISSTSMNTSNLTATTINLTDGSSFRQVPINDKVSTYTLLSSDVGKVISITTGGILVPNAVFQSGDNITIYNNSGSSQSITMNSGVVTYQVATANNYSIRNLAQRGLATLVCVAANNFVISGAGLT